MPEIELNLSSKDTFSKNLDQSTMRSLEFLIFLNRNIQENKMLKVLNLLKIELNIIIQSFIKSMDKYMMKK
jgi:hypothetical protein